MKQALLILLGCLFILKIEATSYFQDKSHSLNYPQNVKVDVTSLNWMKLSNDSSENENSLTENPVNFSTTSEGIYLTLRNGKYDVQLFALTGQLLWSGNLVQGRFFIPVRQGIYFLRINGKSYKVICK